MKLSDVLRSLAALSQENRLRVFRALVTAGPVGSTPTVLARRLKLQPATLSFHLKELANAGLVTQQRNGRQLIYRADYARMSNLLAYLTENCCQGQQPSSSTKDACEC
jgi:DNA-binding transcriptional ArsR family regulator